MTTNKTPIQELIDWAEELIKSQGCSVERQTDIINKWLQKEKAFAFDCWQVACRYQDDVSYKENIDRKFEIENEDFEQFYSHYAEQHPK